MSQEPMDELHTTDPESIVSKLNEVIEMLNEVTSKLQQEKEKAGELELIYLTGKETPEEKLSITQHNALVLFMQGVQ